jgi:hypothetical protein
MPVAQLLKIPEEYFDQFVASTVTAIGCTAIDVVKEVH